MSASPQIKRGSLPRLGGVQRPPPPPPLCKQGERERLLPQSPPAQKGRGKIRRVERPPPPPPLWEVSRSSSGLALFHVTTTTTQLLLLLLLLRQSRARFRHRNMWVVWKEEGKKGELHAFRSIYRKRRRRVYVGGVIDPLLWLQKRREEEEEEEKCFTGVY